jgi:hypothetical protein
MSKIHCYFDETKFFLNNIEYIGLAGVFLTDENKLEITDVLYTLKDELESDQFLGRRRKKKIFHFTDDNQEIQPRVIECLRTQNVRVYIAYKKFVGNYQDVYHSIITKILYDRFQKNYMDEFIINYEENPEIKPKKLQTELDKVTSLIRKRRKDFLSPILNKITKDEILNVLPDYFLGTFNQYHNVDREDFKKRNFEKFRKKIRLIVDIDNGKFYHKYNPYII